MRQTCIRFRALNDGYLGKEGGYPRELNKRCGAKRRASHLLQLCWGFFDKHAHSLILVTLGQRVPTSLSFICTAVMVLSSPTTTRKRALSDSSDINERDRKKANIWVDDSHGPMPLVMPHQEKYEFDLLYFLSYISNKSAIQGCRPCPYFLTCISQIRHPPPLFALLNDLFNFLTYKCSVPKINPRTRTELKSGL